MSTTKEMKDELIPLIVSRFNHSRPHFSTEEQEAINKKYGFQEYTKKLYHCSRCGEADPSLLYKCKKCFITHYCSLECENADWTQHNDLCQHGKPKTAHELKTREDKIRNDIANQGYSISFHELGPSFLVAQKAGTTTSTSEIAKVEIYDILTDATVVFHKSFFLKGFKNAEEGIIIDKVNMNTRSQHITYCYKDQQSENEITMLPPHSLQVFYRLYSQYVSLLQEKPINNNSSSVHSCSNHNNKQEKVLFQINGQQNDAQLLKYYIYIVSIMSQ